MFKRLMVFKRCSSGCDAKLFFHEGIIATINNRIDPLLFFIVDLPHTWPGVGGG